MKFGKEITGFIGLLAGTVPLASIFMAVTLSPWFSFTNNFLSDLGGGTAASAFIFNSGLMIGGILGTVFALIMISNSLYRSGIGMSLFLIATISLVFVGLFPVNLGMLHTAPSVVFFLCSTFALILIGWRERRGKRFPWFIFILGIISLMTIPLYAIPRPIGFNATTELVTSLAVAAFVLMTSMKVLTEPS